MTLRKILKVEEKAQYLLEIAFNYLVSTVGPTVVMRKAHVVCYWLVCSDGKF